jgi:hypothetical protein
MPVRIQELLGYKAHQVFIKFFSYVVWSRPFLFRYVSTKLRVVPINKAVEECFFWSNLIFRVCGVLVALPLIHYLAERLSQFEISNARQIANFHMGFNITLAVVFLPLINRMAKLTQRLIPEEEDDSDEFKPMSLDKSSLENPQVALVNAEREVLRMGEVVERMFRNMIHCACSFRELDIVFL